MIMHRLADKKKLIAGLTLLFGIIALLVPIIYSFGGALAILILNHPLLPIPWGLYVFKVLYLIALCLGFLFSIIGLILKPGLWSRELLKISIGLIFIIFSAVYFGRIVVFTGGN